MGHGSRDRSVPPPFRWDERAPPRFACEDAAFFHLYLPAEANGDWRHAEGETAEDLASSRSPFLMPRTQSLTSWTRPHSPRKDEEKFDGDYRTKRVILKLRCPLSPFAPATRTDPTRPTPADPECCIPRGIRG